MTNINLTNLAQRATELYASGRSSDPEFSRLLTPDECNALWGHVEPQIPADVDVASVKTFFDSKLGNRGAFVFAPWRLRDLVNGGGVVLRHVVFEALCELDSTLRANTSQHLFIESISIA